MFKSFICWVICKNKNLFGLLLVIIFIFNEVINFWGIFFGFFENKKSNYDLLVKEYDLL